MHRTYSMRQSRAPTASQLQNPPPPQSSTKHRLFGIGEFLFALSGVAIKCAGPFAPIREIRGIFRHFSASSTACRAPRGRSMVWKDSLRSICCRGRQHESRGCSSSILTFGCPAIPWAELGRLWLISLHRQCQPYLSKTGSWCLWPRSLQEAISVGQNGEKCDAKHGTRWP
jgi:hypothetical protein